MIQGTRQLIKTLSSQAQGMTMMMMLISPNTIYMVIQSTQRQHNHLPQGLHQHHTSQGDDHIILMKCLLYHKSRVEWHTPQESQHGILLLFFIQKQKLQNWKLSMTLSQKGSRLKWQAQVKLHTIL